MSPTSVSDFFERLILFRKLNLKLYLQLKSIDLPSLMIKCTVNIITLKNPFTDSCKINCIVKNDKKSFEDIQKYIIYIYIYVKNHILLTCNYKINDDENYSRLI